MKYYPIPQLLCACVRQKTQHAFFFIKKDACFRFRFFLLLSSSFGASSGLRDLIARASVGDTITLEPRVYSGASNCDLQIDKHLTLISPSSQAVLNCFGLSRCVSVLKGASVTIIGVTLTGGSALRHFGTRSLKTTRKKVSSDFQC